MILTGSKGRSFLCMLYEGDKDEMCSLLIISYLLLAVLCVNIQHALWRCVIMKVKRIKCEVGNNTLILWMPIASLVIIIAIAPMIIYVISAYYVVTSLCDYLIVIMAYAAGAMNTIIALIQWRNKGGDRWWRYEWWRKED